MIKFMVVAVVAAMSVVTATGMIQRPNLTGTWVASSDAPAGLAAAPSSILGTRFAIALDGNTMTVTRPNRDDTIAVTYKLDGTPTTFPVAGRLCEGQQQVLETAKGRTTRW